MKNKLLWVLAAVLMLSVLTMAACTTAHIHALQHVELKEATCTENGTVEYWYCPACGKYFSDEAATTEITLEDVTLVKGHTLKHRTTNLATCTEDGNRDCYQCTICGSYFEDKNAEIAMDAEDVILPKTGHAQSEGLKTDDSGHWYTCTHDKCAAKLDYAEHSFDNGKDYDDTQSTFTCAGCGYQTRKPYLKGTVTGIVTCSEVVDYSTLVFTVTNGTYSYTFTDVTNADGGFSFDTRIGEGYTVSVSSIQGFMGSSQPLTVKLTDNAALNISMKKGFMFGNVLVNGKMVKSYANISQQMSAAASENLPVSIVAGEISEIPSTGWGMDRRCFMLPISSQVQTGEFAFNATLHSGVTGENGYEGNSGMWGYAGIGITDGTSILFMETPAQANMDGGGVRLCFGQYTATGWKFNFAMIVKCGGVDSQLTENYRQRFSIRRYEDCIKLYSGDICFGVITAEDGLMIQDNYAMINSPFSLKRDNEEALANFMNFDNEYALLYGCDYGFSRSVVYEGDFSTRYKIVNGKVELPADSTARVEETRLVVYDGNSYSTFSGVVAPDGTYTLELPIGAHQIYFNNPGSLSGVLNSVIINNKSTTIDTVTLEQNKKATSTVVVNGTALHLGEDLGIYDDYAKLNPVLKRDDRENALFDNTVYNGTAKWRATMNLTNTYGSFAVGLTDGSSMIRFVQRNGYKNKVEFEFCMINPSTNYYWVSNYRTYIFTADFLPTYNAGTTNGDLNYYFVKNEDGSIDAYYETHLLVKIKTDGFYLGEGVSIDSRFTINDQRKISDPKNADWAVSKPEASFMAVGREYAVIAQSFEHEGWGNPNGTDAKFNGGVEVIRPVVQPDTKAEALKQVLNGKYLSLLGDSITTWDGISNVTTNNSTIATGTEMSCYPYYDVDKLEEIYWYKLLQNTGMNLLVNNSIGGSRAYGEENDSKAACNFRCENLHADTGALEGTNPDVILVYIGINDVGHDRETAEQFAEGYRKILTKIKAKYPDADVFAVDLPYPGSSAWLAKYDMDKFNAINGHINSIATELGVNLIHLRNSAADDAANLTCDMLHPNVKGMQAYYEVIRDALYEHYCNN